MLGHPNGIVRRETSPPDGGAGGPPGRASKCGGCVSGRDQNAVNKTLSGLLKLIHPSPEEKVSDEDLEWAVRLALECRRRVKEQQKRLDTETPVAAPSKRSVDRIHLSPSTRERLPSAGYPSVPNAGEVRAAG